MMISVINFTPALAEIFLGIMLCIILLVGVFFSKVRHLSYWMSQATLIISLFLIWISYIHSRGPVTLTFNNTFIFDDLALILKALIAVTIFFVFTFSKKYNTDRHFPETEFYVLGLIAVLGMFVLVSGHNLITLYLGIELLSLPTYAMVALQKGKSRCIEASMKYFLMGALASGILLYGFSILFGITKSLAINQISQALSVSGDENQLIVIFALIFIIAGIAFKLGAAPFHVWVPDVYDGAPNSVTLFISTAPKLAAFALLVRLLVEAMPVLVDQWQQIILAIALISIALGNLVAIVQTNIKRLLAYSSIAHIGYMLLGIACGTAAGDSAALFYIISYTLMTLGAFGMVTLLSHAGYEANLIEDFAGLNSRHSWLAFMMMLIMFSLAGIPPLIGFMAKVSILETLIEIHLTWVAVVAILFAIVGAYYYIRVIKVMYFEEPTIAKPLEVPLDAAVVLSIAGIATLLIGIFPGKLFEICHIIF